MSTSDKMELLSTFEAKINPDSPARARLAMLFDPGTFVELDRYMMAEEDMAGVVAGYGLVEGATVYAYAQEATVNSGAVSEYHAKKICKVYELAAKTGCPVVSLLDSKGAKVQENAAMLNAYSKMLKSANNLSGVVPQISVVLGTCAGIGALVASAADFLLMSEEAELFLTAPFVAKAKGDSTPDAGSAKAAAAAGVAAAVYPTEAETIAATRTLLTLLPQNNLADLPLSDYAESGAVVDVEGCPKEQVMAIADADSAVELYADFGKGVYTLLATVAGVTTGFVATSRINPLTEQACRKAAGFVRMCDALNIPVVTLLDSEGFAPSADLGQLSALSRLSAVYAEATTQKVAIITGKAFGAVYAALGARNSSADITLAWPKAQISALAPDTAVEFLWADRFVGTENAKATHQALVEEYVATVASPFEAAKLGYIEGIIAPADTRATLIRTLDMLAGKRETKLPKKHITLA